MKTTTPESSAGKSWLSQTAITGLFYGVLILLVAPVLVREILANDVWKALYTGRYLAYFHQFPHHSTFTFAPVVDFLPRNGFNWLGNIIFYGTWLYGGLIGLHGIRILMGLLVVVTLHSVVDFERNPLVLVLLALVTYGVYQKLLLRTALFALPGLVLLYWTWDRVYERQQRLWLYLLPPLFLVWSNLHGSYVVGLILLGCVAAGTFLNALLGSDKRARTGLLVRLSILLVLSVLATTYIHPFPSYTFFDLTGRLANQLTTARTTAFGFSGPVESVSVLRQGAGFPGAGDLVTQARTLLETLLTRPIGAEHGQIAREFDLTLNHPSVLYVRVGALLLGLGGLTLIFGRRGFRYDLMLPYLASAYLGISYVRGVAYVSVISVFVVLLQVRQEPLWGQIRSRTGQFLGIGLISLLLGPIGISLAQGSIPSVLGTQTAPIGFGQAPRFTTNLPERMLQQRRSSEHTFNTFNMGANLIWKWWPRKKVFIDSKTSAYRDSFVRQYTEGQAQQLVDEHRLTQALVPRRSAWNRDFFEPNPNWTIRTRDEHFLLYEGSARRKP